MPSNDRTHDAAEVLAEGLDPEGAELVRRAVTYAEEAHRGQRRASGDPYITHPVAVATILRGETRDAETLAAAVLHDVVEDTSSTLEEVRARFGENVARIVEGVTKIDRVHLAEGRSPEAAQRLMLATAGDLRVLLVKLCDRLHNMRTLQHLPEHKRQRIASETRSVHVPLAGRIGTLGIRDELAEHAFRQLHPEMQEYIAGRLSERAEETEKARRRLIDGIPDALRSYHIEDFELSVRIKSPHSIHEKMQQSGRRFEHVHDLLAMRIIVPTDPDCYTALGAVHRMHPPVVGRFADHIALPKRNLYQSLHTTVLVGGELTVETQIRTQAMHRRAQHGFAAHWRYKQGSADDTTEHMKEMAEDPQELLRMLRLELTDDETTVFTPAGEVVQLPSGATSIDLAYRLHSEIGDHAVGAVVDGRPFDLAEPIPAGSTVRIVVDPSRDIGVPAAWLAAARTTRAVRALRSRRRSEGPADGKEWERALVASGIDDGSMEEALRQAAEEHGASSVSDLEAKVRTGAVPAWSVSSSLAAFHSSHPRERKRR